MTKTSKPRRRTVKSRVKQPARLKSKNIKAGRIKKRGGLKRKQTGNLSRV